MFEIDRIPSTVLELIEQKGISRDSLCLGAFCDRDRNHMPAQIYLLATKDQLLILEGAVSTTDVAAKRRRGKLPIEKRFLEHF